MGQEQHRDASIGVRRVQTSTFCKWCSSAFPMSNEDHQGTTAVGRNIWELSQISVLDLTASLRVLQYRLQIDEALGFQGTAALDSSSPVATSRFRTADLKRGRHHRSISTNHFSRLSVVSRVLSFERHLSEMHNLV